MTEYLSLDKRYDFKPLSLAIGLFDGLHIGHQELFKETANSDYETAVLTFSLDWKTSMKSKDGALLSEKEKERDAKEILHTERTRSSL